MLVLGANTSSTSDSSLYDFLSNDQCRNAKGPLIISNTTDESTSSTFGTNLGARGRSMEI
jgi:hypothetical protein